MFLIKLFLPLNTNQGTCQPRELLRAVREKLIGEFGGVTPSLAILQKGHRRWLTMKDRKMTSLCEVIVGIKSQASLAGKQV